MKYLKLFETLNISSKINIIEQYHKFLKDVEPIVWFIYEQRASEIDFDILEEAEEDDDNDIVDINGYESVELDSVDISDENRLRFTLLMWENAVAYDRNEPEIHYFFLSIDELDQGQAEMEANKYNI